MRRLPLARALNLRSLGASRARVGGFPLKGVPRLIAILLDHLALVISATSRLALTGERLWRKRQAHRRKISMSFEMTIPCASHHFCSRAPA